MGVSILDAHPNNECIDLSASEAWFSFIFCGSRIDTLNLHAYDYYTGEKIISGTPNKIYSPSIHTNLAMRGGVGNGVRVNIKDFVENAESVFNADGEYTWRAELVQNVDVASGIYPDNMVYEGVLVGSPTLYAKVDNVKGFDYENYLPLTSDISKRIKPPYYVDFLDSKYNGMAYDIPITYDESRIKDEGSEYTAIRLTTYASTVKDTDVLLRPAIGTRVLIHKKKNYGTPSVITSSNPNVVFIDNKIPFINKTDNEGDYSVNDGVYLKVSNKYYKVLSYNKATGAVTCQNGSELNKYPAGTHYSIYTSRFWTPHYYFRVHNMPKLKLSAEFHERRRMQKEHYDDTINCLDNTFNGILFKAELSGDPHAAVKYFYWEIFNAESNKRLLKTERIYSQEMECEFFVPFGNTYTGRITVVTQDSVTLSGKVSYTLPASPIENDERFKLRAVQNRFGGIELAWDYNYWYDGGSFLKATDFEVFRVDKRLGKVKYLGKVNCEPLGISGVTPAFSGHNWYLLDKDCKFKLKAPVGAKVNMYLVGGGRDGGTWNVTPNELNKSFAVGTDGGEGGYFHKKTITCDSGVIEGSATIAQRNDVSGTKVTISGTTYKCNGEGSQKRGTVSSNTMTQAEDYHVIYNDNAENGVDGFATPYGVVGSSGGGGASCGGNKTAGVLKSLSVSGITLNGEHKNGNWLLIDRDDLGGASGEFDLNVPENTRVTMWLVGGGSDGSVWIPDPKVGWDTGWSICYPGGGGGYVLEKKLTVSGTLHCSASIADANDNDGTQISIDGNIYKCNDNGSSKTDDTRSAAAAKDQNGNVDYRPAKNGIDGIDTPYGIVGSSGGGGGYDNGKIEVWQKNTYAGGKGGVGAGNGGYVDKREAHDGEDAENYGCGGGGGSGKEHDYKGNVDRSEAGKGKPGCIIFKIEDIDAPCPEPGYGGVGAGDGGFPLDHGDDAVNYGCGGGNAGFFAVDSTGQYLIGNAGKGMQGCVILEIDMNDIKGGVPEQVYAVDWTAASDKEYRYIVTGCNYESAYLDKEIIKDEEGDVFIRDKRHPASEMIECTAYVDIKPHFNDFFVYFLNDADVLCDTKLNYENYETPLIEPMGRYVTSKNNNYRMIKRHNHTLALERDDKSFYRRHTWRIEGDVKLGEVTHNITRNVNALYARMPSVTDEGTDFDSFPMSFLFGYLDCEASENSGFVYDDQYLFELWKKCVFEKKTVMIKDPKGNVWTGVFDAHGYEVEYDTDGMPYNINVQFTQTRTEHNTRVMIVDDHNKYLKNVKDNHLK